MLKFSVCALDGLFIYIYSGHIMTAVSQLV